MGTLKLLRARRFGPLFWTQLLGAFNDNLYKNALVAAFAFGTVAGEARSPEDVAALINLSAGIFILPFFLFSAVAGQIADRIEKARLVRAIKLVEIGVMLLAAIGFALESTALLLVVLFLMGTHSAFFGPLKYGILPQHLPASELVAANGLVGTGTFVAIVLGTLCGTLLPAGAAATAAVAVAAVGYLKSRGIPEAPSHAVVEVRWNPITESVRAVQDVARQRPVFLAMLGISWFWLYGALYLAQLPSLCTELLGGDERVMGILLVTFAIGIGAGSLACARLARGRVEPGWIFLGCVGLTLFGGDLYAAATTMRLNDLAEGSSLFAAPAFLRLLADLALLGFSGGLYVVPLYAYVQHRTEPERRSRAIAANNILNALFMVLGSVLAIALRQLGLGVADVLLAAALFNVVAIACVTAAVRRGVLRFIVSGLIHVFYRIAKRGLDRVPENAPALLVCNHPSVIDAPIIAAACTRPVRFVMYHRIYNARGLRWFFEASGAIPIAPRHEDEACMRAAFDEIERALRAGEIVCIFPEGKVTKDGELNDFRRGVEEILARTPVPVVPMALRGLWGSVYSRAGRGVMRKPPRGFGSRVEVVCGDPVQAHQASAEVLQERVAALRGDVC